jgi:hypothetical protein
VPKPAPTNPPPLTATSTPAPAFASEARPPVVVPLAQTSAVPAQLTIAPALLPRANAITPPPESPGIGRKGALAIGVAFLAGGLAVFMFRRTRKTGGDNPSARSMKKD